jgi:hypothetical protein
MASGAEAPSINDKLPPDILRVVFEHHAQLEWRAPAIIGQVCRFWRQQVLHHPRAWSHIELHNIYTVTVPSLRLWLDRSGATPLSISIYVGGPYVPTLCDVLSEYHERIQTLRAVWAPYSFFASRTFPLLQELDVERWYSEADFFSGVWGPMPRLHTLRIRQTNVSFAPLGDLPPLTVLAIHATPCASLVQKSCSTLTSLMLEEVAFLGDKSDSLSLPSLTYLSLYAVVNLKPRIVAPALVTYHEGGYSIRESFPASLPTVTEYGIFDAPEACPDFVELHHFFPHISRLSIRAPVPHLPSILASLANKPAFLPHLQIIAVGSPSRNIQVGDKELRVMKESVLARNIANKTNITLCVKTEESFHIPLYFALVCCYLPSSESLLIC